MENKNYLVLNRNCDFNNLKQNGSKFFLAPWFLVNFQKNKNNSFRCGWTIPKKVGSAVIRNRFKRWCREYFRSSIHSSFYFDCNIIFLGKKDKEFFKRLKHETVINLLDRAIKKIADFEEKGKKNGRF